MESYSHTYLACPFSIALLLYLPYFTCTSFQNPQAMPCRDQSARYFEATACGFNDNAVHIGTIYLNSGLTRNRPTRCDNPVPSLQRYVLIFPNGRLCHVRCRTCRMAAPSQRMLLFRPYRQRFLGPFIPCRREFPDCCRFHIEANPFGLSFMLPFLSHCYHRTEM